MNIPGDPSPEEHQQAFELLHRRAVEMWGDRAEALDDSLREASQSILRLEGIRFSRNDAPGFFLHEQAPGGAQ